MPKLQLSVLLLGSFSCFFFLFILQVSADGHVNAWDCSVDADGLIAEKDLYKVKTKSTEDVEDDIPLPEEEDDTKKETKSEGVYITSVVWL